MKSGQQSSGGADPSRRPALLARYARAGTATEQSADLLQVQKKELNNKVKAMAQLSTQKNSPRGVDWKDSPRELASHRRQAPRLASQTTSVKGSDSHQRITEQEPLTNPNGTFSFNNQNMHPYEAQHQNPIIGRSTMAVDKVFSLYKPQRGSKEPSRGGASNGYESPASAALRLEAPIIQEPHQETRNQIRQQSGARKSIEHKGEAGTSGEKNRTPSKYQPLNDLNEMRGMRDQARRFKNNSQYTSSTQPQIISSLPSGKIMIMTGVQNTDSSKDINVGTRYNLLRPAGGPSPGHKPTAGQSSLPLKFMSTEKIEHSDGLKSREPSDQNRRLRPRIGSQYEDGSKPSQRVSNSPNRHLNIPDFQRGPDDINSLITESVIKVNEMIASATSNMAQNNDGGEVGYRPRMSSHSLEKQTFRGLVSQNKVTTSSIIDEELPPVQVVTVKAGHLPANPRANQLQKGLRMNLIESLGPGPDHGSKQVAKDLTRYQKKKFGSDNKPRDLNQQRRSEPEMKLQLRSKKGPGAQTISNPVSINLFDTKFKNAFEIGLDTADYPEDGGPPEEHLLCLEHDKHSLEERSARLHPFPSKQAYTRMSNEGLDQPPKEQRTNSRRQSKKSRNNINTIDIYTKNSEGEKQIEKFLIQESQAPLMTKSFDQLSDDQNAAEREAMEPTNRTNQQEKNPSKRAAYQSKEEQPRNMKGKAGKTAAQAGKRGNDILTKKTQIHLASPLRASFKEPSRTNEKQFTQRDKHKAQAGRTGQRRNQPQRRMHSVKPFLEARPKDLKSIIKTNEPVRKSHIVMTPSQKNLAGANRDKQSKKIKTVETHLDQNAFHEIPHLDFQGIDADQLPEVHVEEEEFIEADQRSANFSTPGGFFKPQTTRNVKQNSFADNQAMKSQSNYSEWLNSQRDSRLKGSYHEKMKLDDLKYENKGSNALKKTMQPIPSPAPSSNFTRPAAKVKKNLKIEDPTLTKRSLIAGTRGIKTLPSTTKGKNDRNRQFQAEHPTVNNQYRTNKVAMKSHQPSFVQGPGSSKQILSSTENTHLSSGQLNSSRKVLTNKMLGKVVKTSKLDLDTVKRKEAQMSASHLVSAGQLPASGPGSGRPKADLAAKKASERSFKKAGANASNQLGSPATLHPAVGPNKKLIGSQKQYASVQSMAGPQSSAKKTTIQTKGATRSGMLNSSHISNSNLELKQRQKLQGKNANIHKALIKKDTGQSALKMKNSAYDFGPVSSSICVPGSGQKGPLHMRIDPSGGTSAVKGRRHMNQGSDQRLGSNRSDQAEPEPRREFRSQQRAQPQAHLEKQKRELKLELEKQMKHQRQQNSGSDMRLRSKNSHSKEVSGGSQTHSLQRVKFQQDQDMIYQTLDSPSSSPRHGYESAKASAMLKHPKFQAIQPFKQDVHALINLLQKASETPPGPVAEAKGHKKSEKIEQIYEMQEELDSVMQQIKAQFKAQIRK